MTGSISRRTFLQRSAAVGGAALAGSLLPLPVWAGATRIPRTIEEKVGQLFVVSFAGLMPSPAFLSMLERYGFGGVVLYGRNVDDGAAQIRSMIEALQRAAPFPLLVSVDQEGGRVERIKKAAPVFPWEAVYGEMGSTQRVYDDAAITARALRSLGLTMNLAPVVDVLTNPRSPIGKRSYGPDPQLDARLAVSAIRAYQSNGIAATAKHFVGLGSSRVDSHHSLPVVNLTPAQLESTALVPFRAAIAAGVSSVMVAHVWLPRIDPVYRPASLSPIIIKGLLRKALGFKGVVMTDSLVMGAVPAGQEGEASERAFRAGADMMLVSGDRDIKAGVLEESVARIVAAVRSGSISERRLDRSVARILALKARYPALPALPRRQALRRPGSR